MNNTLGSVMVEEGLYCVDPAMREAINNIQIYDHGDYRLADVVYGHKSAVNLAQQTKFEGTLADAYIKRCEADGVSVSEDIFKGLLHARRGTVPTPENPVFVLRLGDRLGDPTTLKKTRAQMPVLLREELALNNVKHLEIVTALFFGEVGYTKDLIEFNVNVLLNLIWELQDLGVTYTFISHADPDDDLLYACNADYLLTTYGGFSLLAEQFGLYSKSFNIRSRSIELLSRPLVSKVGASADTLAHMKRSTKCKIVISEKRATSLLYLNNHWYPISSKDLAIKSRSAFHNEETLYLALELTESFKIQDYVVSFGTENMEIVGITDTDDIKKLMRHRDADGLHEILPSMFPTCLHISHE